MTQTGDPATWHKSTLLQEVCRLSGQRDALRAFAQDIMRAWPEGDVDGGELQEAALRHGLLERSEPTQQERDENGLDEYDDWYRPTELLSPNAGNQRAEARRAYDPLECVVRRTGGKHESERIDYATTK